MTKALRRATIGVTFHPASELFPPMAELDLRALADDIRAHGLHEPIVLLDGAVLDGRNRLRACEMSGVEPQFIEWSQTEDSSPIEWVVSHNLHRRHLTVAQRAALALNLLPQLEAEARERQIALGRSHGTLSPETDEGPGRSDQKAADLVGVGRSTVANVKAIAARDSGIVERMRSGEILTVAAAAREAGFEKLGGAGMAALDDGSRTVDGRVRSTYFGKGDKWVEATLPLVRYLAAFEKRDYKFSHVAPKEARKRLATIDSLLESLAAARGDLETRSHIASLTIGDRR